MPLWQVRVLQREKRKRGRGGTISIKSDTECIDKDPNSGNILGNNFKLHVCHGKVERPESPSPPPPLPCPFCQTVTHFTISFNALENRIRAQARAGINHPKKCVCAFLCCAPQSPQVFSIQKFAGVPGSIHFLLLYP